MIKLKLLILVFCILTIGAKAQQDVILKTNGDTIHAKILEVGTNAVSFKKAKDLNGPTFVENKTDIVFIKFKTGEVQHFTKAAPTQTTSMAKNTSTSSVSSGTTTSQQQDGKNKIELVGKKFTINGQKATRKDVNNMLSRSKNPAIIVPLKATKAMGTAQKIVKITSIPTTIGGGFTTLFTGVNMWNDIQRGRATSKSYTDAVISLLSTITLPITNKILKKKSDKMYNKLIDLYNVTN